MHYCDKCGGPLRFGRGLTVAGCRLCWLEVWTSQEVRWDDVEERGFSAEGESLNSVLLWMTRDAITYGEVTVDFLNSTADSPATSTWLPPGQRELRPARSSTERAFRMWLRDVQWREDEGEWELARPRAMNAPTIDDYMRAIMGAADPRYMAAIDAAGRALGRILDDELLAPLSKWPGDPVSEDDLVSRVLDGPARRL